MKLILKIAFRELLNSKKFVWFFILNLSLGILGFLVLHSFKTSVNESLSLRSRTLLASDISVSSRKELSLEQVKIVDEKLTELSLKNPIKSFVSEVYSMGQNDKNKKSRLIQIKMISGNYPLYGEVTLKNQGNLTQQLRDKFESTPLVWASAELAHQLKVKVGDKLRLGDILFTVDDIVAEDTTSSSRGISLAPKLYVHHKFQKEMGLISQGSVANYTYQYKVQNSKDIDFKKLQTEILDLLDDPAFKVLLPENSSEQVGRVLNYLSDYLGLVSLVAIFLSAIGAAFLFQDFVFKKIVDIAILKSLGLSTQSIFKVFSLQLGTLGTIAVLISGAVGSIILPLGSQALSDVLKVPVSLYVSLESMAISLCIALLFTFLICYPIIQKLIGKKSSDLFGGEKNLKFEFNRLDFLKFLPLLIAIELVSIWQSHSVIIGSAFTLILILSSGLIFLIIPYVLALFQKFFLDRMNTFSKPFNIEFGVSMRFLIREKIPTTLTFLSISIGVMLLSIISQLEVSLNEELLDSKTKKPSLFMFDIQQEQRNELVSFAKEKNIPILNLTPMVRARISKINGKEFTREKDEGEFQTREDEQRIRFRNRGINLTYSNELNYTQTLTKGKPFDGKYTGAGEFEISLDQRYADRIKADIGTTLTFDVLGVEFKGIVTSLRKIKWTSFLPNFFITLQEGVVEDAPQSYLGAIDELDNQRQLEVQDLIVDKFPNISIINVSELLKKISGVFSSMSFAIKVMAYLCIFVGFFVVYAIIQNQLRKKQYDILLLKSFGMGPKNIVLIFAYKFIKIAVSATILGAGLSLVVGNLLSQVFFDGVWKVDFSYYLYLIIAVVLITFLLVLLNASGVYKKPIRSLLE